MDSRARKSFDKGVGAAESGNRDEARTQLEAAVSRDPNAYAALYNLGVLADRDGNERDAIAFYERSLRALPDYEPAARGIATISLRRGRGIVDRDRRHMHGQIGSLRLDERRVDTGQLLHGLRPRVQVLPG